MTKITFRFIFSFGGILCRQYLWSRSLLMTTPGDSSFSSQSDDFGNLNDSQLSESLIYCLNGNEPDEVGVPIIEASNMPVTPLSTARNFAATNSMKRPLNSDDTNGTAYAANSSPYVDCSYISAKKNHLELDETDL